MSMEFTAIISVAVALAGLILNSQRIQRAEIKAVRTELRAHREETQAEFKSVRAEMQAEFKSVQAEMQAEFKIVREEMNGLRERMAHLEGLLEGLREAITGRRVAVAEAVAEQPPGDYNQR